jgi:hypothetical protein
MTSIQLPSKRINPEIIFWDLTIYLITLIRTIVSSVHNFLAQNRKTLITLLAWLGYVLAGFSLGWYLGIASL